MGYNKGRLIVEKEGYYYIYSKVQFNAAECSLTQHKVMKDTEAYGKSIELMKSKKLVYHSSLPSSFVAHTPPWRQPFSSIYWTESELFQL